MGGPDDRRVGQAQQPLQRGVLGAGKLLGAAGVDEVGAGRRAHQQRPAGEHAHWEVPVEQEQG